MLEKLKFTNEQGEKNPCDIEVYALSTCGFCKRALEFLRSNKITFRYIYVDQQDSDLRLMIKNELADRFEGRIGFPFAVINGGEKTLVGFTEEKWKEAFLK
ncbi:MAG: glutaredoxin family protein [Candidatus Heimdallarchaeota archaeon]|nr:glutaredoxin family protein [Candidatus Heimdallarchaeota archaeon]